MKRRKSTRRTKRTNRLASNVKHAWRGFRESFKMALIWIGVFAVIYLALIWR